MAERMPTAHLNAGFLRDHVPDEWMDGGVWKITRGEDFDIHTDGMRRRLRRAAAHKQTTVAVRRPDPDTLTFSFQRPHN